MTLLRSFFATLTSAAVDCYKAENYQKATDYFEKVLAIEGTSLFKTRY